jgi:hypothetical protein
MKDIINVLALDPGKDTGWANIEFDPTKRALSSFRHVKEGLVETGELHTCGCGRANCGLCAYGTRVLFDLVLMLNPDVLVIEDFILTIGAKSDRHALAPVRVTERLIATVIATKSWTGRVANYQSSAMAKSKATDSRLRAAGLWIKGQRHARDAVRHLVIYVDRELS